jgi:hypothetical protein
MDITCKKKSEAFGTLESVLVQISISFPLQFCWSLVGISLLLLLLLFFSTV